MTKQAWHFLYDNWQTGYDKLTVKIGEKLTYAGEMPPISAKRGLHASERLIDALEHAYGAIITAVECSGTIVEQLGDNKFVCTERTALWGYDATDELRVFSRLVAKEALDKFYDEDKFEKLDPVIKQWLETGDESLRSAAESAASSAASSAAWSAAWSAAESAASSAAWSAAYSAARSAAESAASSAASSAAESAARSAAWSAAYSAARSAASSAASSAARSAAESAAYSAARSAARSAQNETLTSMILEGAKKRGLL